MRTAGDRYEDGGPIGALIFRRGWLVLACAIVAAAGAWLVGPREAPREKVLLTFVLRPNTNVPADAIPDSLRASGGTDSQLTRTVSMVIATDRILRPALRRGGVPPGGEFELKSSVEPGTDIVSVELSGKEGVTLEPLVRAYSREASLWVSGSYKTYTLQFLDSAPAPSRADETRVLQLTALAGLAGALLGVLLIFAEYKLRRSGVPGRRDEARPPTTLEDVPGQLDNSRVQDSSAREGDSSWPVGSPDPAHGSSRREESGERPG